IERGEPIPSVTAKWLSFIEDMEERSEDERLMYVSMTRAQERLICCGTKKSADSVPNPEDEDWIDRLTAASDENGAMFRTIVFSDPMTVGADDEKKHEALPRPAEEGNKPFPAAAEGTRPICGGRGRAAVRLAKFSASAYSLLSWCPVAYRRRYRQGWGMRWESHGSGVSGGAELGSLAHWILTRWDFDRSTLSDHIPPVDSGTTDASSGVLKKIPAYLRDAFRSPADRAALRSWLEAFSATETCDELRELKSEGVLRREMNFSVKLGGTDLAGSIDLYWEDADGCHVRDWKITPEASAPSELYVEQVRFYSLACHIARPGMRIDAGLIYLRPDDSGLGGVGREHAAFEIDDWAKLAYEVSESSRIAVTGPFEPKTERCGVCPYSSSCRSSRIPSRQ
ncbi:MAG: PD-(D/E)XK nuclease family protein, partial [Synergistaceae bacterium]|nr:PD-(D/E)XK nuclease family protein [Synergistaceae bacterium]